MPLLHWSEEEYQSFKMRCGCAYLQYYMPQYPALIDELIETRLFWAWWCNRWLLRDEAFISSEHLSSINLKVVVFAYKSMHCPIALAKELKIESLVFEDSSISKKPNI